MEDRVIDGLSFSAIINSQLEKVDIRAWCFRLPDEEYQGYSPARFAAGLTAARDCRGTSINVGVKPLQGTPESRHQLPRRS
jgi:hypothetical protein